MSVYLMVLLSLHDNKSGDIIILEFATEIVQKHLTLFSHRFDLLFEQSQTSELRFVAFIWTRE